MNLNDKIVELIKNEENFETGDWYSWNINLENIPCEITLSNENSFIKNKELRLKLNQLLVNTNDIELKREIIHYYVVTWGNIKGNGNAKMEFYYSSSIEDLKKSINGIASWSKILSIYDPRKYAIYDARVSASLNCIQKIFDIDTKILSPILPSQNKIISSNNVLIREISKREKWKKVVRKNYYEEIYLPLLNNIANELKVEIDTVEMYLFANAEKFANKLKCFQIKYLI